MLFRLCTKSKTNTKQDFMFMWRYLRAQGSIVERVYVQMLSFTGMKRRHANSQLIKLSCCTLLAYKLRLFAETKWEVEQNLEKTNFVMYQGLLVTSECRIIITRLIAACDPNITFFGFQTSRLSEISSWKSLFESFLFEYYPDNHCSNHGRLYYSEAFEWKAQVTLTWEQVRTVLKST